MYVEVQKLSHLQLIHHLYDTLLLLLLKKEQSDLNSMFISVLSQLYHSGGRSFLK